MKRCAAEVAVIGNRSHLRVAFWTIRSLGKGWNRYPDESWKNIFHQYDVVWALFFLFCFPQHKSFLIAIGQTQSHNVISPNPIVVLVNFLGNAVTNNEENAKLCICPTCPTYKKSNLTGNVFCARGKAKEKVATNGCLQIVACLRIMRWTKCTIAQRENP